MIVMPDWYCLLVYLEGLKKPVRHVSGQREREKWVVVRDTTMGGRENNLISVLEVPSHCPFVLPLAPSTGVGPYRSGSPLGIKRARLVSVSVECVVGREVQQAVPVEKTERTAATWLEAETTDSVASPPRLRLLIYVALNIFSRGLLGCDAVHFGKQVPTFRMNMLLQRRTNVLL
jgi:hypothetical protein